MPRAASMAKDVVITVVATAAGCWLVLAIAPTPPGSPKGGVGAHPATPGHAGAPARNGSAARAATSALGGDTAPASAPATPSPSPSPSPPEAERIEVTAPTGDLSFRANGSFSVSWTNNTGKDVDVWLNTGTGEADSERLALVVPRAGSGTQGEALVSLPRVPPGSSYSLEVAAAGTGGAHAFSEPFAVTA
jgi:hypothetical protein